MMFKKMKKVPQNETARSKTPEIYQTNRMGTKIIHKLSHPRN